MVKIVSQSGVISARPVWETLIYCHTGNDHHEKRKCDLHFPSFLRIYRRRKWRHILVPQDTRIDQRFLRTRGLLAMIALLTGVLLTGACGFKLRGQVEIPPELNPMSIQPQHGSPVGAALVQQLQGSQVRLTTRPQDARVIIRLSNEKRGSRVAAVDRNGKALAYELHYQVSFDAVAPDGKQLVPPQSLDVVRTYDNADVDVLGKQLEADLIYEDMIQDAANRILGRMRAVLL